MFIPSNFENPFKIGPALWESCWSMENKLNYRWGRNRDRCAEINVPGSRNQKRFKVRMYILPCSLHAWDIPKVSKSISKATTSLSSLNMVQIFTSYIQKGGVRWVRGVQSRLHKNWISRKMKSWDRKTCKVCFLSFPNHNKGLLKS